MPFKVPFTKDETYTRAEIDARIGGAAGGFAASMKTSVTVLAAGWTSQTAGAGNPVPTGETWYYADLTHGLGSSAYPATAYDISGFNVPWQTHQIRSATVARVWLAFPPSSTIVFKVNA